MLKFGMLVEFGVQLMEKSKNRNFPFFRTKNESIGLINIWKTQNEPRMLKFGILVKLDTLINEEIKKPKLFLLRDPK